LGTQGNVGRDEAIKKAGGGSRGKEVEDQGFSEKGTGIKSNPVTDFKIEQCPDDGSELEWNQRMKRWECTQCAFRKPGKK
jgi:hypothetical protein